MRNELGTAYVVCGGGVDAWCEEEYSKIWLDDGTLLVMYCNWLYAKIFCPETGLRYTLCHDDFFNFTVPLE